MIKLSIAILTLFALFSIKCFAQTSSFALTEEERKFLTTLLQQSLAKFDQSIANLTPAQFQFRPSPKKWTVAECIEHVCLAELHFLQIVKEELSKPAEPNKRKKVKISNEKIIARLTNRGWRVRAPEIFKPSGKFSSVEEAIATFRSQRLKNIAYVDTINEDLRNHFWKHPATGVIDLYQTMVLMSAHLERHIAQIEEIKGNKNYPKN